MVDAKKQQFRSSPSGPIGGRKISGTIGGKGTTIGKNASHTIALTPTQIPAIAGVKATDLAFAAPDTNGFGDGNVGIVGAFCQADEIQVRFVNPTGVDVTDYTVNIEIIVFPFNIA